MLCKPNEIASISTKSTVEPNTNILKINNDNNKYSISQIEDAIKTYDINFDVSNYEKQTSRGSYSKNMNTGVVTKNNMYVDYLEKIGDFITNSGYTVEIDNNNEIIAIYDYTNKKLNNKIKTATNVEYDITENQKKYYLELAESNVKNSEDIIAEDIKFIYDLDKNEKYVCIEITLKDTYDVNQLFYKYEL